MGRYSGILLCSDFDGTLSHDGLISEENMQAIRRFRAGGGLFTVASGRYYDFLLPFFEGYDFGVPLITLNGAVLYDVERSLVCRERFMSHLDTDYINSVFDASDDINEIVFYTKDGFRHLLPSERDLIGDIDLSTVYKLSVRVDNDIEASNRATAQIKSVTPDFMEVARSWYWGIEVQDIECTKGPATCALAEAVDADRLICVGDFENDISMIKSANIGYAVGNSIESLISAADRVTVPVWEHAIAKIIEEL